MLATTAVWPRFVRCCATILLGLALAALSPEWACAQLERLPPVPETGPGSHTEPNWADEALTWSKTIKRGRNGLEGLTQDDLTRPEIDDPWTWQLMPAGLIYRSYLAGVKEPRFASVWNRDQHGNSLWDITLGGRVSIVRYGTMDGLLPKGWELQMEGAAMPRLMLDHENDLGAADFRFGIPMAYSQGAWEYKLAYYHLSAHKGDEQMVHDNSLSRINYSRDCFVLATAFRYTPDLRFYGEAAWAFQSDGGARPWEFQFGVDYSPLIPNGIRPLPFLALNGYLRQDVNFGGNFCAQTGIQWRGPNTGQLFRFGFEYYNGASRQFQFFRQLERQYGIGLWFDY